MPRKIVVTGGAGFIGGHLVEALLRYSDCKIFVLDNYTTGTIENHVDNENVCYINGETKEISSLIDFKPDLVFHLGEYSRVEQSFDDWKLVFASNVVGTQKVFEFCLMNNCKIIYAGSSTKFGDNGAGADSSPYAWSKSSNTRLLKNYGEWFGLEYAITYFYNAYGPREIKTGKYATLIGIFSEKFKNNEPLPVVLPGTQERNFTHVKDIAEALILIGEKGIGDDYGIGHDKSYSILEVAKLFGIEISFLDPRRGNRISAPVISAKTRSLGWKTERDLESYIDEICK